MALIRLLQTRAGRVIRVMAGLLLLAYGGSVLTFTGVVAMMAGVVSLVTGVAGLPHPPTETGRHSP